MENKPPNSKIDKLIEKIPPFAGLIMIFFPVVLSFFSPEAASYFIIIINVYFFYKSMSLSILFAISLLRIREVQQIDWVEKLEGLANPQSEIKRLEGELIKLEEFKWESLNRIVDFNSLSRKIKYPDKTLQRINSLPIIFQKIIFSREKSKTKKFIKGEIEFLKKHLKQDNLIKPSELKHVVMVPHAFEPYELLRKTLINLRNQTIGTKNISVVLGAEFAEEKGYEKSLRLKEEFENDFEHIWVTNHKLTENELVGKSSNMAWAGREAVKYIKELGWDLKKVTMTSCDADSKLPNNYFAYLSYLYLTTPDSEYKFFNGAMVFYNNIWRLPFYARVKNSMSSIYNVARMVRTDKLMPFSTYTTSFWIVEQIGYWTPWVTPEDFHLFFKAIFKFQNKVSTVPLYIKIMSDAAEGKGHWDTIKNNYKQERRWSWGVSDDGWVIKNLVTKWNKFTIRTKYMAIHVLFDHIIGIAGSLTILLGGNVPPLINPAFKQSVLGVRLPGVSSNVIRLTIIFLIIVIILDFFLKPRPKNNPWWRNIVRIFEWVSLPYASMFLSMVPGIEAHTRLLFGRYLEYYVTKKIDDSEPEKLAKS